MHKCIFADIQIYTSRITLFDMLDVVYDDDVWTYIKITVLSNIRRTQCHVVEKCVQMMPL